MIVDDLIINANLVDILNELKRQLSNDLLHDIKDSGDNVMITCPFHKHGMERKPSAGLRKDNGIFHCFTCGESHTLPEIISWCFGFKDSGVYGYNWLIKNFASVSVENRKEIKLNVSRETEKDKIEYVSEDILDSYRYYHPYMYKRGLTNEIIEMFDVGYNKDTECITFPIRDVTGNTLFVASRSVNSKYFNYPSGVRKPVYGLYELSQLSKYPTEVIICESILDALTCWVSGKYAVALNGLGSVEQFNELSNMPNRKFILATDNDSAGRNARVILKQEIKNHLITEYLLPNDVKDINELGSERFNELKEVF